MAIDNEDRVAQVPSVGVDVVELDRYADIETEDGELIVYDEDVPEGWIQTDVWTAVEAMR